MKRSPLTAWLAYALTGLVLTVLGGLLLSWLLGGVDAQAVWLAAAIAYGVQLLAFALLLKLRAQPQLFVGAWLGGMVLRFGALGACAFWLSRTNVLPRGTTLLSLVVFVFVLLLLEPVFLRWDLRG